MLTWLKSHVVEILLWMLVVACGLVGGRCYGDARARSARDAQLVQAADSLASARLIGYAQALDSAQRAAQAERLRADSLARADSLLVLSSAQDRGRVQAAQAQLAAALRGLPDSIATRVRAATDSLSVAATRAARDRDTLASRVTFLGAQLRQLSAADSVVLATVRDSAAGAIHAQAAEIAVLKSVKTPSHGFLWHVERAAETGVVLAAAAGVGYGVRAATAH